MSTRAQDLVRHGAAQAAGAFAALLGRTLRAAEPRPWSGSSGSGPLAAVVCDVRGEVEGVIALVLTLELRDQAVASLCPGVDPTDERAASALREVGNIVASHAVSAIADRLGVRITLSVPTLLSDAAGATVAGILAAHEGEASFIAESELEGSEGATGARLIFAGRATSERF